MLLEIELPRLLAPDWSSNEVFSNRQAASLPGYFKLDMLGFRKFHKVKCQKSIQNF